MAMPLGCRNGSALLGRVALPFLFLLQNLVYGLSDDICNRGGFFFSFLLQLLKGLSVQPDAKTHILWVIRFWSPCAGAHPIASLSVTQQVYKLRDKIQDILPTFYIKHKKDPPFGGPFCQVCETLFDLWVAFSLNR